MLGLRLIVERGAVVEAARFIAAVDGEHVLGEIGADVDNGPGKAALAFVGLPAPSKS